MGARGRGAIAKPKPAAPLGGRPPVRLAAEVYAALRAPTLRASGVLDSLLDSADERTRLLAAKALVELGSKPKVDEPEDAGQPKPMFVQVKYDQNYRASTG